MDEGIEAVNEVSPWEIQPITNDDIVFRQVPVSQRETFREKKIPLESHFALRPGEDELSFNLDGIIDVPKNFKLIGITHSRKGAFLDCATFKIFKFPVVFLKTLGKFEKIIHTPKFDGAPSPLGRPNNKSHSSLYCGEFNDGTRAQLRDYCKYNDCECPIDINSIKQEIAELIERHTDTPYHNYWEFDD